MGAPQYALLVEEDNVEGVIEEANEPDVGEYVEADFGGDNQPYIGDEEPYIGDDDQPYDQPYIGDEEPGVGDEEGIGYETKEPLI